MEKIYVISGRNGETQFVSSVAATEKLAKTLCEYKNLYNKIEGRTEWTFDYEEKLVWKSTDLQWFKDQITELKMKELPF